MNILQKIVRLAKRKKQPLTAAEQEAAHMAACEDWEQLAQMGCQAIPTLRKLLSGKDRYLRAKALRTLSMIRDPRAVNSLISLSRKYPTALNAVIVSLGYIGGEEALSFIISILKKPSPDVQKQAVMALGRIGNPRAVNSLISLARKYPTALNTVIASLGYIGGEEAVSFIISSLKETSPDVQEQAAKALGRIGDCSALPSLQKLWRETPISCSSVRIAANDAIRKMTSNADPGGRDPESWLPWMHDIYIPTKPKSHVDVATEKGRNEEKKSEENQEDESKDRDEQKNGNE